jgi:hypothetical protein
MSEPSPYGLAAIIGGIPVIGGGIWGAIKWIIGRNDRRQAALDIKEDALVAKLELRVAALEADNRKIWLAFSFVVPALQAHDPQSPALRQAAKILGDAFPIDLDTPADMTATLGKIV